MDTTTPEPTTPEMETESMAPRSIDDILNDNSISSLAKTINDYING